MEKDGILAEYMELGAAEKAIAGDALAAEDACCTCTGGPVADGEATACCCDSCGFGESMCCCCDLDCALLISFIFTAIVLAYEFIIIAFYYDNAYFDSYWWETSLALTTPIWVAIGF